MLTIDLTPHDLTNVRFAFSPLWELVASKWALMKPSLQAVHLSWINEAHQAIGDTEFPYFSSLITDDGHFANFLLPRPQTPRPTFADELERLRQTSAAQIRRNLAENYDKGDPTIQHFRADPEAALAALCRELEHYWRLTLAQHWPRIHAVLESDVIYRARQLALEGPDVLFNGLNPVISYADNRLIVDTWRERHLEPGGDGLLLIPLVFMWNDLLLPEENTLPAIAYGARGGDSGDRRLRNPAQRSQQRLARAGREVLQQLDTPRNTGELAERLGMTAGNISIHIARLREAGLVESQQTGKWVFHRLTQRGEQLMALFAGHQHP